MGKQEQQDNIPDELDKIEEIILPGEDERAEYHENNAFKCLSMVMHYPEVENIVGVLNKVLRKNHEG